jgi:hypothetical protein
MLTTIKLNDNPFVKRDEINYVRFYRLLPAKLDSTKLAVSQVLPQ